MTSVSTKPLHIARDHPAFDGHFPGRPLLPGVVLLSEVLAAAQAQPALAERLGPRPMLVSAKFLSPVRPGDDLVIELAAGPAGLRFDVRCADRVVAKGQFAWGETA